MSEATIDREMLEAKAEAFEKRLQGYMPGGVYYEEQSVTAYERVKTVKEDMSNLDPRIHSASVFNPDLDPESYLGGAGSPYVWAKGMDERMAQAERMADELSEFGELYRAGAFKGMPQDRFMSVCDMLAAQTAAVRYGPECLTSPERAADQKLQYACLFMYGQSDLIEHEPTEWVAQVSRVIENERLAEAAAQRLDDKRPLVTIGLDDKDFKFRSSMRDVTTATRGCFYTIEAAQLYLDETVRDHISRGEDYHKGLTMFPRDNDMDISYDLTKTVMEAQDRTIQNRKDWILDRSIQDVYVHTGKSLPVTDPERREVGILHRLSSPSCPKPEASSIVNPKLPDYAGCAGSAARYMAELPGRVRRAKLLEADLAVLVENKSEIRRHPPTEKTCARFGWPGEPAKMRMHAFVDSLTARVLDVKYGTDVARLYLGDGLPAGTFIAAQADDIKKSLDRMSNGENMSRVLDGVREWREAAESGLDRERERFDKNVVPVAKFTMNTEPHADEKLAAAVQAGDTYSFRTMALAEDFMKFRKIAVDSGISYPKGSASVQDKARDQEFRDMMRSVGSCVSLANPELAPEYAVRGQVTAADYGVQAVKKEPKKHHEPMKPISAAFTPRPRRATVPAEKAAEPVETDIFSKQHIEPGAGSGDKKRGSPELDKTYEAVKDNVPDMDKLNPDFKG